jgi:hypothetical protein
MSEPRSLQEIIETAHEAVHFGTVQVTLKKSFGNVTTVDITKNSSRKVTGSAQALTLIGTMLKLLGSNHETGQLTFTIGLKHGEATELLTNDFQRDNLDNTTGKYK